MIVRETVDRVSVPVRSRLRQRMKAHPEELGFPAGASEASILAELVEVGARVRLDQQRRAERLKLYEEWADDSESRESVQAAYEMAAESGLI